MRLRKLLFKDSDLGEHARDVQRLFDQVPDCEYRTFQGTYVVGMILGSLATSPRCIELVRCVGQNPSTPTGHGTAVEWVWRPELGGCQITKIDGLTASASTQYVFTFRVTK